LLLKELTISVLGYNFHCVILGCGLVESMSECFAYDRAP
jgi:hypothetical protein